MGERRRVQDDVDCCKEEVQAAHLISSRQSSPFSSSYRKLLKKQKRKLHFAATRFMCKSLRGRIAISLANTGALFFLSHPVSASPPPVSLMLLSNHLPCSDLLQITIISYEIFLLIFCFFLHHFLSTTSLTHNSKTHLERCKSHS